MMACCVLLPYDPIAELGVIIPIIGVAVSIVAAIAAIKAAVYAKAAPSKEDLDKIQASNATTLERWADIQSRLAIMNEELKRLADNIAETSGRMDNVHSHIEAMNRRMDTQHERDALLARVNRVSLRIIGDVEPGKNAQITISARDESVVLNRVDLYNESENKFGSAQCEDWNPPLQKLIRLDGATFMKWFEAGSLVTGNPNLDRTLCLRVYMKLEDDGDEVYRSMTVTAMTVMPQPVGRGMTPLKYRLYGEV